MTNSTRICKVCGKEYPYCKTVLKDGDIFRWQDVACCLEHGSEYFALIEASRSGIVVAMGDNPVANVEDIYIDEDDDNEEDEVDFEDDEEDIAIVTE